MSGIRWFLSSICLLLIGVISAQAQPAETDHKALFAAYTQSPAYKAYLEKVLNLGEPSTLKAQCPSLHLQEWDKVSIIEQPKFVRTKSNFQMNSGVWVAYTSMDRCGSSVTRRVLLKAVPGKNLIEPTFLMPGDFRGNLRLEVDARRIVFPGIAAYGQCNDPAKLRVLDIKSLTPASPQGWSETWIAEACDKTIEVTVTYFAYGNGMNISARDWKVR